jgi:hypothetical protein
LPSLRIFYRYPPFEIAALANKILRTNSKGKKEGKAIPVTGR